MSLTIVDRYGCSVRSASDVALLGNGDVIVYTVGSVVVIYDVTQHSQRHYLRHTASVTWYVLFSDWYPLDTLLRNFPVDVKVINL